MRGFFQRLCRTLSALAAAAACLPVLAAPINLVDPGSLTVGDVEDFEAVALGDVAGVLDLDGVDLGERFAGQTTGVESLFDDYETIEGSPDAPLALAANALASENLRVEDVSDNRIVSGLLEDENGVGAFAVLFEVDQFEIGLTLGGADLNLEDDTGTFRFYRRDGTLIDTVLIVPLKGSIGVTLPLAFRREGAVADLAGFTFQNDDFLGVYIDDLIFSKTAAVPSPPSLALLAMALAGYGFLGRRGRGA